MTQLGLAAPRQRKAAAPHRYAHSANSRPRSGQVVHALVSAAPGTSSTASEPSTLTALRGCHRNRRKGVIAGPRKGPEARLRLWSTTGAREQARWEPTERPAGPLQSFTCQVKVSPVSSRPARWSAWSPWPPGGSTGGPLGPVVPGGKGFEGARSGGDCHCNCNPRPPDKGGPMGLADTFSEGVPPINTSMSTRAPP